MSTLMSTPYRQNIPALLEQRDSHESTVVRELYEWLRYSGNHPKSRDALHTILLLNRENRSTSESEYALQQRLREIADLPPDLYRALRAALDQHHSESLEK